MNFLPFVFTFLLLLTLISSFMFSSVVGTTKLQQIIASQHKTYLSLISTQHEKVYKSYNKSSEKKTPSDPHQSHAATAKDRPPRFYAEQFETSTLNLHCVMHEKDRTAQGLLKEAAIRLIDQLYGSYEFYSKVNTPSRPIARRFIEKIMEEPLESLEAFKWGDPSLDETYYKMLKGTHTNYSSLYTYFRINNKESKPIYFRYASKPVLRAVLGEELSRRVFEIEEKNWRQKRARKAMVKKDFIDLLQEHPTPFLPVSYADVVFNFSNGRKGAPRSLISKKNIRATHHAPPLSTNTTP